MMETKNMRTIEGGNVHTQMMVLAKDYLEKQGYTVVLKSMVGGIYIDETRGIIDVLGIKNGEKVAIECQILPSPVIMKEKLDKYKPYITKLILAVPKDVYVHDIPPEIEVLTLDVTRPTPKKVMLQVAISLEANELLRTNCFRKKGDLGNVIDALIKKEPNLSALIKNVEEQKT